MNLKEWKDWKGYKLRKCAEALGISESFLSLLLRGKRGPSPEMALQIEKKTHGRVRREDVMWPDA
jgi:DNA-binding transcriptional regulator YdaS (Cro superfamily)